MIKYSCFVVLEDNMKKIFILSMFLFVLFFSFSINLTSMNHNQVDESYV